MSECHLHPLIADVFSPAHFFVGRGLALDFAPPCREVIPWEIFRGRLLDPAHTRLQQAFTAWNIYQVDDSGRSATPLLSIKLDAPGQKLHVTRAIYCHAWEGYHAGDNVYLSRETRKWVNELVGTIDLSRFPTEELLREELVGRVFQAVIGVSRLPLTSVEAPLPAFALGLLAYFHRPHAAGNAPLTAVRELITHALHAEQSRLEKVKLLECVLRAAPIGELTDSARLFVGRWSELGHSRRELIDLLRSLFDEVALSPFTDFVAKTLAWLHALSDQHLLADDEHVDFLGYLLRHLVRHLTAYDLITFHHQGANYPDALLLDAALQDFLAWNDRRPDLFLPAEPRPQLRRRALRQGWLLRRFYEGLLVPDAPTTPGENARVMPPPHLRVPQEQILDRHKRTRKLYDSEPLSLSPTGRRVLQLALADLADPDELRELGMAVFLDRPLGVFKPPAEPDQTLLLSVEAFSRSIAQSRLAFLADQPGLITDLAGLREQLLGLAVPGVPFPAVTGVLRPGTVSLDDARKVADDFLFLRTTRRSVHDFRAGCDFSAIPEARFLESAKNVLILRGDRPGTLRVYDADCRPRLELEIDAREGYVNRAGRDFPTPGLRLTHAWNEQGQPLPHARGE